MDVARRDRAHGPMPAILLTGKLPHRFTTATCRVTKSLSMTPESNNQSSNGTGKMEKAGESSKGRGNGMHNPGRKSRNPYLNFLREFRRQNYHLSAVEVVRRGAAHWRQLTEEQRLPYVRIAFYAPMRPRRCPLCGMRYRMKRAAGAQSSAQKGKLVKSRQMRTPAKKQH
uniref:HMG box domain-containing protein n=1 Tax=Anopheles albimanus TaxID=7167 RepID=A0A182F4F2_ANOAL